MLSNLVVGKWTHLLRTRTQMGSLFSIPTNLAGRQLESVLPVIIRSCSFSNAAVLVVYQ
jgi:hypothetical protein